MDIFKNVEREIGPYTTWPSYILKYLFCEHLNITNRIILCAFFYGNGLSPHRTVDLIRSCARSFDDSSDARSIQNWFKLWNKSKAARAKKIFYNLMLNKVTDLNGCKIKLLLETKKREKGFEGVNEGCISQLGLTHNSPHQLLYAVLALM